MSIDYTRRAPRGGGPAAEAPRPTSGAQSRGGTTWAVPVLWRSVLAAVALNVFSTGHPALGAAVLAVAVLPLRWMFAWAGLATIRWWVVRRTRPYRHLLPQPGRVTDPQAPWRQWLDTRCGTCGH